MHIFHGGCHGCTNQDAHGVEFCVGCQYFRANWNLPDLNDEHQRRDEAEEALRRQAEAKYYKRPPNYDKYLPQIEEAAYVTIAEPKKKNGLLRLGGAIFKNCKF